MAKRKPGHSIVAAPLPAKGKTDSTLGGSKHWFNFSGWQLPLLLGVVSFVVYANTLQNGFVLDDHVVIKDNAIVTKGISAIPEILSTPYHMGWTPATFDNLYRPLSLVFFAAAYQLFGLAPAPYHFVNILVFAGCVILLFFFLNSLFERKKSAVAFITALLFALHPIHTEVVANIKSLDELLCFFFSFLALNLFIMYLRQGKTTLLTYGCFSFLLAMLAKETAVTFIAVVPFIFFFYRNENKKRSAVITAVVFAGAGIALAMRLIVFHFHPVANHGDINVIENALAAKDLSPMSRIATAMLILGYYVKLLFFPYPLISDYSFNSIPYADFAHPLVLASLALYLTLVVVSIFRLVRYRKDPYAFAIIFFLCTISLFTNIPFLIGTTMGERLLFFCSVGFCLVIALALEKLAGGNLLLSPSLLKKSKLLTVAIPILLIYTFLTIGRNADWSDNFTLYKADVASAPGNARLHQYIGDELITNILDNEQEPTRRSLIISDAVRYLTEAIAIYPDYSNAHSDLGMAYAYLGANDSAEYHFRKAIDLDPNGVIQIANLSRLYFNTKKYALSIEYSKRALTITPQNEMMCANIGLAYIILGQFDSAIAYSGKAIGYSRGPNGPSEIVANAYKAKGMMDSAKKYEVIAQADNPRFKL